MSHPRHIDENVETLVQLCGYSIDHARAELTAIAQREKVGLISTTAALELLAQRVDSTPEAARAQWQNILRGNPVLSRAA